MRKNNRKPKKVAILHKCQEPTAWKIWESRCARVGFACSFHYRTVDKLQQAFAWANMQFLKEDCKFQDLSKSRPYFIVCLEISPLKMLGQLWKCPADYDCMESFRVQACVKWLVCLFLSFSFLQADNVVWDRHSDINPPTFNLSLISRMLRYPYLKQTKELMEQQKQKKNQRRIKNGRFPWT